MENTIKKIYIPEEHLKPFWFKSGKDHPYFGKKRPEHSEMLKGRKRGRNKGTVVVIRECSFCHKIIEALSYRIYSKNIFCNKECKDKFRVGKNAINYIHGNGYGRYGSDFEKIKSTIRERDDYICQCCNMTEEEHLIVVGEVLSVHHIDYNKSNNNNANLITLCRNCNTRANFNRDYWISFYKIKFLRRNKINGK